MTRSHISASSLKLSTDNSDIESRTSTITERCFGQQTAVDGWTGLGCTSLMSQCHCRVAKNTQDSREEHLCNKGPKHGHK